MTIIEWNDSFSVNVDKLDRQHKKLVEILNELGDAMKHGKGIDELGRLINNLALYAAKHFETEEMYFNRFQYPGAGSHRKEHATFLTKAAEFQYGLNNSVTLNAIHFLKHWLITHIQETDKKYSTFFNENGLK